MKNIFLLIVFSVISLVNVAQSYTISPSNTIKESAVYNGEHKFKIYFTNISNSTITLQWKVISNQLIAGWDCFICDNVSCCKGVPQNGTLPYIDPGIDVYLALNVNPKAVPGIGTLTLYVYDEVNPSAGDTLTWIINSTPTGMNTITADSGINIFPNPACDYAMIDMNAYPSQPVFIRLYNSSGQLLMERAINTVLEKLDMTPLPSGLYHIAIADDRGDQVIKTLVK